ncbi:hypothetical protein EDF56_104570 [Novosphingobium sp. PhB165]|uniref:hypothetical protein n=1 Tax=Novosphingobium sp. PhB165 TaxID=2485105 RepID=UPI001052A14D|nr:hypothetical protein [Novosphingobium sp. PhB165]TCM19034.1 hypothetical protein EDF56_104570 [Novosphingobium sp. PhB165]
MSNPSWKFFASANVLVLGFAVVSKAWSQDPAPAPAAPPAMAADADARDQAVAACMAEGKSRGDKLGAADVSMKKVEDTDKKSDGRASVRAEVDVAIRQKDGSIKMKKKTFKCDTRHGVVTAFSYS